MSYTVELMLVNLFGTGLMLLNMGADEEIRQYRDHPSLKRRMEERPLPLGAMMVDVSEVMRWTGLSCLERGMKARILTRNTSSVPSRQAMH
jgi:hypothetical protein